ncbi:MAG: hypothetical protein JWO80_4546, partial [Bryobacterales bacterium]|nr:hypothetical protein [Bryobacterales bacterium]
MSRQRQTLRRRIAIVCVLTAAVAGGYTLFRMRRVQAATELPSAVARRGEFLVLVRSRGELTARVSVQITAPRNV